MALPQDSRYSDVDTVLNTLSDGNAVGVFDFQDKGEFECDIIVSAETVGLDALRLAIHAGGERVCAYAAEIADQRLRLPLLEQHINDPVMRHQQRGEHRQCNFVQPVEVAPTRARRDKKSMTTGVSLHDRLYTLRVLADPTTRPADLWRPGHQRGARAHDKRMRGRTGHTETAVTLCAKAQLAPVALMVEVTSEDHEHRPEPEEVLRRYARHVPIITIQQIVEYLEDIGEL